MPVYRVECFKCGLREDSGKVAMHARGRIRCSRCGGPTKILLGSQQVKIPRRFREPDETITKADVY